MAVAEGELFALGISRDFEVVAGGLVDGGGGTASSAFWVSSEAAVRSGLTVSTRK